MRIGEVAAMAGVSVQTIRFYERRGLLRKPKRLPSGYRYYSPETVKHVRLIKQAQGLGFTLNEIKHLALLRAPHPDNATEIRTIAKAKIQSINNRISFLEKMRDELSCLLDTCVCGTEHPKCIISK